MFPGVSRSASRLLTNVATASVFNNVTFTQRGCPQGVSRHSTPLPTCTFAVFGVHLGDTRGCVLACLSFTMLTPREHEGGTS